MDRPSGSSVNEAVRLAWDKGDAEGAVTATLEAYGAEILGWLVGVLRDVDEAEDAFAAFTETLWSSFARFGWRCSVRTWAYALARHAAVDQRRSEARRARRQVPLSAPEVAQVAERIRTTTLASLRTVNRTAIARLRDELPADDRMLLVLRVDRELAWDDLARVFLDAPDPEAAELKREAARLRKRFQLIKEQLVSLARGAGLIEKP